MSDRVTLFLDGLFDFWNDVPRVAREFRHYDPDDREDYLIDDCTIARSSISVLKELWETFAPEEEARYQDLLVLIALNQHYVDEMRRGDFEV
ncbi:MAG TPA: hypothetical protein PLT26_13670 [Anaerolineaceae bacterium]|nr:hypothetical protein [Anaerolineaceae bacterium]